MRARSPNLAAQPQHRLGKCSSTLGRSSLSLGISEPSLRRRVSPGRSRGSLGGLSAR